MLQAVKVPASPDTKANTSPATVPPIAVAFASWPSRVLATLSPMTESTNSNDHSTASRTPAAALTRTIRPRARGWVCAATWTARSLPVTVMDGLWGRARPLASSILPNSHRARRQPWR